LELYFVCKSKELPHYNIYRVDIERFGIELEEGVETLQISGNIGVPLATGGILYADNGIIVRGDIGRDLMVAINEARREWLDAKREYEKAQEGIKRRLKNGYTVLSQLDWYQSN
jgi:hypothetical protein